MKQILSIVLLLTIVAACTPQEQASVEVVLGEVIYENSFDDPFSWETFGVAETQFGISNGVYTAISNGGGYIPVTNGITHSNVVIEVTAEQVGGGEGSTYGISCRAQAANPTVAYYFLINSAGSYGLRIGEGADIRVFVPWTEHPAINTGLASNTIRAVCVDDYFALYINDKFITEARHDWLTEGSMGFAVTGETGIGIAVNYDDVTIWDASIAE